MLLIAAATKLPFILIFFITTALPVFALLGCCFGKKSANATPPKKTVEPVAVKNGGDKKKKEQINDAYLSKTTNKVVGLGPDDPDLDSTRLKNSGQTQIKQQEDAELMTAVPTLPPSIMSCQPGPPPTSVPAPPPSMMSRQQGPPST